MKALLPLPNKMKKAMDREINRQISENLSRLSKDLQAVILWELHQQFGFGKQRLLKFRDAFAPTLKELSDYYQSTCTEDTQFACAWLLKKECGIDVSQVDDIIQMQAKFNK